MHWRVVKVKNSISVEKINAFSYGHHSDNSKTHDVHAGWITEKKGDPKYIWSPPKKNNGGDWIYKGGYPILSHFQPSTEIVLVVVQ